MQIKQSTLTIFSVGHENLSSMDMNQASTWPRDQYGGFIQM